MTIEEKARAYDEALEQAKKELAVSGPYSDSTRQIFRLFPELKENNDERIRKKLIKTIRYFRSRGIDQQLCEEFLAYIENLEDEKPATIEQVYGKFLSSDILKSAKKNKYIRAQLLWELMHNGIITEVDYQYLTDANRKPWTEEEYRKAYKKGFEASELLKHLGM